MPTQLLSQLHLPDLPDSWDRPVLRDEVRSFLHEQRVAGAFTPRCDAWLGGFSPAFSREMGRRGWLGMTWPERYGGKGRSGLDRFAVAEEVLAAGAPVAAHWIAERQSGPAILRYGTEEQKRTYLPGIARGETYFAIGMSEPDSGSDLASVRTRALRSDGGWRISGTKVWTSHAQQAQHAIVLVRTGSESGRADLSQFIVDLAADDIVIRPIATLAGEAHFNEVFFDGAFVPDNAVLGTVGDGWNQVMSELGLERSGPERYLSTWPLLTALAERAQQADDERLMEAVGPLLTRAWAIRRLSARVAAALDAGRAPQTAAALVKDLGTTFELQVADTARLVVDLTPRLDSDDPLSQMVADATLHAPGFTIRGGTTEILRGIIAKGLLF